MEYPESTRPFGRRRCYLNEENLVAIVDRNFKSFSQLEGSQFIASKSSQLNLAELLVSVNPKNILDWGSGIGTLIPIYLRLTEAQVVAYERNSWCRSSFYRNIGCEPRVELCESPPIHRSQNFITIDDKIRICEVKPLIQNSEGDLVIFIEGWRNTTFARISFLILLLRRSAKAVRLSSRLGEFGDNLTLEAAGCYLLIKNSSLKASLSSWCGRTSETQEFLEFLKYLARVTRIYRILGKARLGTRVRSLLGLKTRHREKAWLRMMTEKSNSERK